MLTKLTVRNFKRFRDVEVELGNPVVFIGPNNSGKTTALQALALWEVGLKRWIEKRGESEASKRIAAVINRRDLAAIPVPHANLLWRDLHVRDVRRDEKGAAKTTKNIRIDIVVEGVTNDKAWVCGLEFDYDNQESLYCRPLRLSEDKNPDRMPVLELAYQTRMAFLPPMSGLSDREFIKQTDEVNFLIGQGRTADVMRNLCWGMVASGWNGKAAWKRLTEQIQGLFGVELEEPQYLERSGILLSYRDSAGNLLDISAAGRGLHQTLLLLSYLAVNPGAVVLLDEPDAHLEILRQRQIYKVLTDAARTHGSQIIAASHSEVILNEAAGRDVVVAFLGRPHRINREAQLLKSLADIGFEDYYQAEQKGWVLYLEGSTDLAILQALAESTAHPAIADLKQPFVYYVSNQPQSARDHFHGLREAKPDLVGLLLCDHLEKKLQPTPELLERMWSRREIENYICQPETLMEFAEAARDLEVGPLFPEREIPGRVNIMRECIEAVAPPVALADRQYRWWNTVKASEDFLEQVFEMFYLRLGLPNLMRKSNYHVVARHVPSKLIDPEVIEVLNSIVEVARRARPAAEE